MAVIVQPVSVHEPRSIAQGELDLVERIMVICGRPKWHVVLYGPSRLASQFGAIRALQSLLKGLQLCGFVGDVCKLAFQLLAAVRLPDVLRHQTAI